MNTLALQEAKEVHWYAQALRTGYEQVAATGLITVRDILEVQAIIDGNRAGFRKLPGTELKNQRTGQTGHAPPQHPISRKGGPVG